MNKIELIAAVAEQAGMTKVDARKAIDAVLEVSKKELKKGGKIALVGFGTLGVVTRPARQGRNPRTGKTIKIAAKKVAKFKAAANLLKYSIRIEWLKAVSFDGFFCFPSVARSRPFRAVTRRCRQGT